MTGTAIGLGIGVPFNYSSVASGGTPAWVLKTGGTPATMDVDFVNNRAWNAGALTTVPALIACARASSAYYTDASGALSSVSANTLRYGTAGVLIETSASNLSIRSQEFENAAWSPGFASVTANTQTAPDGTLTADTLTEDATAGQVHVAATTTLFAVSGNTAASVYVKAGTRAFASVGLFDGSTYRSAVFSLAAAGSITSTNGTLVSSFITALANGWYRIGIVVNFATAGSAITVSISDAGTPTGGFFLGRPVYNGNGTGAIHIWGAQVETGIAATSYIPTTTASATRLSDVVSFSDLTWFDGATDSIYAEWIAQNVNAATVWAFDATNDKLLIETTGMKASIANATVANNIAAGATAKSAARIVVNDFAISANGGAIAADASETAPGALTASRLGVDLAGANSINGLIRRVAAFKSLSVNNAGLVTLST